ncbi:MAG: J domain-containing protein [Acidobacteria bacterium]|nr:J domain-containing protein [Acidobacteriota bacterium]
MNGDSESNQARGAELLVLLSPLLATLEADVLAQFQAVLPSGRGFLNLELGAHKAWWQLRCLQALAAGASLGQQVEWLWWGLDDPTSERAFHFLLDRHEPSERTRWLAAWLEPGSIFTFVITPPAQRRSTLNGFDASFRHGELARGFVVKNRGLGLTEPLLEVTPDMDAGQIKRQFHKILMRVHPDRGGSDAHTIAVLAAFKRLNTHLHPKD